MLKKINSYIFNAEATKFQISTSILFKNSAIYLDPILYFIDFTKSERTGYNSEGGCQNPKDLKSKIYQLTKE
ncbi:MAG: hypothetical protein ACJ0DD_07320 [Paracoccaceae bacterium]